MNEPALPDDSLRATSVELIRIARDGDQEALDELFERHFPPLRRWARGRLPRWVRNIAETADLVDVQRLPPLRCRRHQA